MVLGCSHGLRALLPVLRLWMSVLDVPAAPLRAPGTSFHGYLFLHTTALTLLWPVLTSVNSRITIVISYPCDHISTHVCLRHIALHLHPHYGCICGLYLLQRLSGLERYRAPLSIVFYIFMIP